ncbi:MAG TPA: hypothetical protein VFF73_28825 [Planctomycetota bacterium]|nr:hypothetical protein [Planctomycetota bacterium]
MELRLTAAGYDENPKHALGAIRNNIELVYKNQRDVNKFGPVLAEAGLDGFLADLLESEDRAR